MIFTGYFDRLKEYEQNGLTPISIACESPDFYNGIEWKFFAPTLDIHSKWENKEIDDFGYIARYIPERLEVLNKAEIKEKLLSVNNPILLCYEKEGFCPRHVLADWIEANLGLQVQEW